MFEHFENSELHVVIYSIKLVQPLQSYDHLMSLEFLLNSIQQKKMIGHRAQVKCLQYQILIK